MIRIVIATCFALVVTAAVAAVTRQFPVGDLVVETPWLRATPGGARVVGGYMRITNRGTADDRLVGGTLERSARVELHEMAMDGTVVRMRHLPGGIEIKAGQTVELKPGGLHVMGLDLQGGFTVGQTVRGTLQFEKAGSVQVEYAVAPVGAGGPPGGH